jgi:hypothetical protein
MFIDEEYDEHACSPLTTKLQEIGLDQMYGSCINEDNDLVYMAKGLNGIIYRLVQCTHNPPHTNTYPTSFDNFEIRQQYERVIGHQPSLNTDKNNQDLNRTLYA